MTNAEALKSLCTAIASAFYADDAVLQLALFNAGIQPDVDAEPKNKELLRAAIRLVLGFVETSRGEAGISVGIDREAVVKSAKLWCKDYGLDASELLGDYQSEIIDGSNLW